MNQPSEKVNSHATCPRCNDTKKVQGIDAASGRIVENSETDCPACVSSSSDPAPEDGGSVIIDGLIDENKELKIQLEAVTQKFTDLVHSYDRVTAERDRLKESMDFINGKVRGFMAEVNPLLGLDDDADSVDLTESVKALLKELEAAKRIIDLLPRLDSTLGLIQMESEKAAEEWEQAIDEWHEIEKQSKD